jgi:hypothetical protein
VRRRLALGVVLLAACARPGKLVDDDSPLGRSLVFTEEGRFGDRVTLGRRATDSQPARVPQLASVDLDSTIHIAVGRDALLEGGRSPLVDSGDAERFSERTNDLIQLIGLLRDLAKEQTTAVAAYGRLAGLDRADPARAAALQDFLTKRRKTGATDARLSAQVKKLWTRDAPEFLEFDTALAAEDDPGLRRPQEVVQRLVDRIARENRALAEESLREARTLQISAFLEAPGKQPVPLHLDGYDRLLEGKVERRDRHGLTVTDADRQRWKDTVELAQAIEALRRDQAALADLLARVAPLLAPDLGELLEHIATFRRKLGSEDLAAARARIEAAARAFWQGARAQLASLQGADEFVELLVGLLDLGNEAANLEDRIEALRDRWKTVSPDTILDLIVDSRSVLDGLERRLVALDALRDWNGTLRGLVLAAAPNVDAAARTRLAELLEGEVGKALREAVAQLDVLETLAALRQVLLRVLSVNQVPQAQVLHPPESFTVPVDMARDTYLNLERTPRQIGDTITVYASLRQGDREIDDQTTSFVVEQFGYGGRLSPSVVLVTPDRLAGSDDRFHFAPVLSWMHTYRPRPEEGGASFLLRGFEPSAGIHAAFLNFDRDRELEIGLGGTVSFWRDRLQVGAGWNLMAQQEDEGRYYFFLGSDLISILQTIGLARE